MIHHDPTSVRFISSCNERILDINMGITDSVAPCTHHCHIVDDESHGVKRLKRTMMKEVERKILNSNHPLFEV
jgi:hypothetical protein